MPMSYLGLLLDSSFKAIQTPIVTQCISPAKVNDQYLTNMLLKINSKVNAEA
jgi:hypothetical protein